MRHFVLLFLGAATCAAVSIPLEEGFRKVPDSAKPWAYYWWLNGNVDERTIKRDLEAMKQVGFSGLLLFDARGYHPSHVPPPPPKMEFMSKEWRRLLKFTLTEASRLGLEVSVNLSSCAGALKGPWDAGDDVPKKLVWTATEIVGPKFTHQFKPPEGRRFWDVGVFAVRHDAGPAKLTEQWQEIAPKPGSQPVVTEVVDLTPRVDKEGRLTWDVPKGRWTLLRFGYTTMEGDPAHHGQRVTKEDVDVLDADAVARHFERMGKTILQDAGPLAGKTLTHFYSVSWEGALPTWTRGFDQEFSKRRGYSLRPWLPVLAGFTVKNPEECGRFLHDYYKTLGDCFRDNFYGKLQTLCEEVGLKWHAESGGPWNRKSPVFAQTDQLAFLGRTHMPQGEFWFTGMPITRRRDFNRPAAMAARIYGLPLAATEAFTHLTYHWSEYPAALKPFADSAFCDGINHFIWHTYTASPERFGKPGIEYFAGSHINPNVTWFPQAHAFVSYLGRCQFMLRQGQPVVDACVYVGDSPYQHWGRGERWSEHGTLSLPRGFNYDLLSTEALQRLEVSGGNLVLPHGATYRMLIVDLDDETARVSAVQKIAAVRNAGAAVVLGKRKPTRRPDLTGYPAADKELQRLADPLWARPSSIGEVLLTRNILPDFEGPFDFIHRKDGKTDIYFVAGSGTAECIFRVKDRRPELWCPVTGQIQTRVSWRYTDDDRTAVRLALPENGSVFVVFRTFDQPREFAPQPPPTQLALSGPWNVRFGSRSFTFQELTPWNEHRDPFIKYFSGTAVYRKSFELTPEQVAQPVWLQLGEVKHVAEVRLNGKNLGVVWTAPWEIEATGALKPGRNELEITVVNTWVNRLIGDAALPPRRRTAKTNVALVQGPRPPTLKPFQGFASDDPLMPSGLLGPVRLEFR